MAIDTCPDDDQEENNTNGNLLRLLAYSIRSCLPVHPVSGTFLYTSTINKHEVGVRRGTILAGARLVRFCPYSCETLSCIDMDPHWQFLCSLLIEFGVTWVYDNLI